METLSVMGAMNAASGGSRAFSVATVRPNLNHFRVKDVRVRTYGSSQSGPVAAAHDIEIEYVTVGAVVLAQFAAKPILCGSAVNINVHVSAPTYRGCYWVDVDGEYLDPVTGQPLSLNAYGTASGRTQSAAPNIATPPRVEVATALCKGCKAENDVGVKVCWRCGGQT